MPLTEIRYKTWVEINPAAMRFNIRAVRSLLRKKTGLWLVVKSNAYGHGLVPTATLARDNGVDGFCVDSVVEGGRLRESGIAGPILVLGPTLPHLYDSAVERGLLLTISGWDALDALGRSAARPEFHLKIDSGMHRQGFYPEELPKVLTRLKKYELGGFFRGAYTHFASAKDVNYPTFTRSQFAAFQDASARLKAEDGLKKNSLFHCAASGAALIDRRYHLDLVRIGICLYGLWPSKELEIQMSAGLEFNPVLSWRSIVSEVKMARKGAFVGYDMSERLARNSRLAIVPIGYWHGFDRGLSGTGEVLINGARARVRGRVSMDLITVDVTGIPCRVGDMVTLIGRSGAEMITAAEMAGRIDSTAYEVLTRINPLVKRLVV